VHGVTVTLPSAVHDAAHGVTWPAGPHTLDGRQALAYVELGGDPPGADLARIRRQQLFLRALMEDTLHAEMRRDPLMLYSFLDTVTRHLAVDATWSFREMASLLVSLRDLRSADIHYLTVPVRGPGHAGPPGVERLDHREAAGLWDAVRRDRVLTWLASHPGAEVTAGAR
jgi:anionic cell wall polymer biosynthesis LytR-Cps2A-Psr (LCP) family protein